jgi:hypothetical protein
VPISWTNRQHSESKPKLTEMGSQYLFNSPTPFVGAGGQLECLLTIGVEFVLSSGLSTI